MSGNQYAYVLEERSSREGWVVIGVYRSLSRLRAAANGRSQKLERKGFRQNQREMKKTPRRAIADGTHYVLARVFEYQHDDRLKVLQRGSAWVIKNEVWQ